MAFLDLADELLELCCFHANTTALCSLRLTCKRIAHVASRELFAQVKLSQTKHSVEKARLILEGSHLNPLVTSISIVTFELLKYRPLPSETSLGDSDSPSRSVNLDLSPGLYLDSEEGDYRSTNRKLSVGLESILNEIGLFVITPRRTPALRCRARHVKTEHRSCDLQTALLQSALLLCCSVCSAALWIQSRVQERTSLLGI
jgi:hypothetical protein